MSISGSFRLVNARVIDGTGSAPVTGAELVAVDGRIAYVGPSRDQVSAEHRALPTVDARGRTVLPGFFDCHVHVALSIEDGLVAQFADAGSYAMLKTARRLRDTLDAGVTTIRDLGGLDNGFKRALADGLVTGPRANLAVGVISPTGGHVDFSLPNGHVPRPGADQVSYIADTDDQVLTAVRELVRSGADVIKVCTSGGVSSPTDQPDDMGVSERQVALIRAELDRHSRRRRIAAHAQGAAGILAAVRGGVDSVEHGYGISDEGVELMLEKGTFLVPTLSSALRVPDPDLVPPYLYEKKVRWSRIAREHIARALQAGVNVALGTDAGVCPHGRNLLELVHLVELGMSPGDAIVAGTRNSARLLGLDDELGTLEVGKTADLVAVTADPLADISSLADPANVELVLKAGKTVKDTAGLTTDVLDAIAA
ncbi:amidohydrolase family protein [Streptomyces antnestii]|uniref:Amidohydrolase family protein n=1 Tax=Streptomyces antnestii TaxID=2494256 RepID=A0A437NX81_9ACTN|nr:amidohydrolase family protein [Streptomyces sp. San01]RVU14608.1 amidohydrolase family protein [Streptomyces sp. San01]